MKIIKIASVALLFFSAAYINADLIDAEINQIIESHDQNMRTLRLDLDLQQKNYPLEPVNTRFGNYVRAIEEAGCQNLTESYSKQELDAALSPETQTALCRVCQSYWRKYKDKIGMPLCAKK